MDWDAPWDAVFDEQSGPYGRWFPQSSPEHQRQLP
ncbi:hypothetical protein [Rhodococcus sp. LB1]|nr:hypothetical protein [Rhodococcus sp. LB1]